jgi:hypothetical protein
MRGTLLDHYRNSRKSGALLRSVTHARVDALRAFPSIEKECSATQRSRANLRTATPMCP